VKKSQLLLGAAVWVLSAGAAAAADMPMKAMPAPVAAPVFSWTGCYLGVHAGGGATRSSFSDNLRGNISSEDFASARDWGNGGLAGGQIGCNYQTGILVMGIEGEGYWSGMKARREASFPADGEGFYSEARNKSDFTVAGRIGVAYERAFIYGKAGWAWGRFDFSEGGSDTITGRTIATTGSATLNGPLFGLGVEYALTNNWTVKGEYNYINYGLSGVNFTQVFCEAGVGCDSPNLFRNSVSAEKHIFKFGVNYLFNAGPAPLVAKY
jgi:outer membrane immunogenic protein